MAVFFTSDTHFGHGGALGLYRRPFGSVPAMNEAIVARWNEAVGPDDEVWHLGDFAIRQPSETVEALLARLNGRKHLVAGNNDPPATTRARRLGERAALCRDRNGWRLAGALPLPVSQLARHGQRLGQFARPLAWPAEAAAAAVRCRRRCLGFPPGHFGRNPPTRGTPTRPAGWCSARSVLVASHRVPATMPVTLPSATP